MKKYVWGWIFPALEGYGSHHHVNATKFGGPLYGAFLEWALGRITPDTMSKSNILDDLESSITNPGSTSQRGFSEIAAYWILSELLPVLFALVLKVDIQLKLKMMQDFIILFAHAKCIEDNEKPVHIKSVFLEQKGWQKFCLDIMYQVFLLLGGIVLTY